MLTRIAIVSAGSADQQRELEKIRAAFRNPLKYTVREFLSMNSVNHELISFPMEILVMRFATFDERQLAMVAKARRRFHEAAIVVIAKDVAPLARSKASQISHFKLLQESLEVRDLAAIVDKLRKNDPSKHRLHPRVKRDGVVQIIDRSGIAHQGVFLDFAQMGARLEVPNLQRESRRLNERESVQILYGTHRIEAKIVWSSVGKQNAAVAGVRFIAAY